MKMKPLNAFMLAAMLSALVNVAFTATVEDSSAWRWTTAGPYTQNLNGKMFTLSANGGGVSFSSPYFNPTPTTWTRRVRTSTPSWPTASPTSSWHWTTRTHRYPITTYPPRITTTPSATWIWTAKTRKYPTSTTYPSTTTPWYRTTRTHRYPTTTYPPRTTASPTRGVSVCLRFLAESYSTLFTLSPNRESLKLTAGDYGGYAMYYGYSYYSLYLRPNIKFWSHVRPEIWTRLCLTVDARKNVAQLFSSESGSIRKILPYKFTWSGEPVIDFPGFDGQLTDVQVWDYPLRYREVLGYMSGFSGSGSVLTWSSISYFPRGGVLLEDTYEGLEKQPFSRWGRLRGPKGEKKRKESFYMGEKKVEEKQQF